MTIKQNALQSPASATPTGMLARHAGNLLCILVFSIVPARTLPAADWAPSKNVEIVVGVAAGGPSDVTARLLQKVLQERKMLPVTVSVVNRPGGSNAIAWNYVSQQLGDGHYLAMTLPNILTNRLTGIHALSYAEITPIAQLNSEYIAFSVRSDSPLKSGIDLLQRLRPDPGAASIGFSNIGSANHIGTSMVLKAAGLDVKKGKFVIFRGASEAMTALLGGHVEVVASSLSTVAPHLQSGSLRLIAVAAPRRLQKHPGVSTWKEQGVDAVFANWRGVAGPKGMSSAQIGYWDDVIGRIVRTDTWISNMEALGWEPDYMNSADSRSFLDRQNRELQSLLTELGLTKGSK